MHTSGSVGRHGRLRATARGTPAAASRGTRGESPRVGLRRSGPFAPLLRAWAAAVCSAPRMNAFTAPVPAARHRPPRGGSNCSSPAAQFGSAAGEDRAGPRRSPRRRDTARRDLAPAMRRGTCRSVCRRSSRCRPRRFPHSVAEAAGDGSTDMTSVPHMPQVVADVAPLRLTLKSTAPTTGYVDGGWWPHSRDLGAEAADLARAVTLRLGSGPRDRLRTQRVGPRPAPGRDRPDAADQRPPRSAPAGAQG